MPYVTYHRPKQYAGRIRKMIIRQDNVEVGRVSIGTDLTTEIASGHHMLSASMDWCRGDLLVDLAEGEHLTVNAQFTGRPLSRGFRMIFQPSKALSLTIADRA